MRLSPEPSHSPGALQSHRRVADGLSQRPYVHTLQWGLRHMPRPQGIQGTGVAPPLLQETDCISPTPLALWAKNLCGVHHCPGPEGCFSSSRSITQFKALGPPVRSCAMQTHVGSTPCCRSGSVPLPWGPPGPRGVPPKGCHKSACPWRGHPSPPSNCPFARANKSSRSKAGHLSSDAS